MKIAARSIGIIAAVLLSLFLSGLPIALAEPTTVCATKIDDQTDAHVLDQDRIRTVLDDVETSTGADIYVRAFQHTPGGDAATWWKQAYLSCPAWVSVDGKTPKPNVLVIEFGMDRTSAIAYGSNFDHLDNVIDSIRAKKLNSALRERHYTDGVIDTLTAIKHPPEPLHIDIGAFFKVAGIVVAWAIAGIAALWAVVIAAKASISRVRRYRRDGVRLTDAVADLNSTREHAADSVSSIDPDDMGRQFLVKIAGVPLTRRQGDQQSNDDLLAKIRDASGRFVELSALPDFPEKRGNIESIVNRKIEFGSISDDLRQAECAWRDLLEDVIEKGKRYTEKSVHTDLKKAQRALHQAKIALDAVTRNGFTAYPQQGRVTELHTTVENQLRIGGSDDISTRRDVADNLLKSATLFLHEAESIAEYSDDVSRRGVLINALSGKCSTCVNDCTKLSESEKAEYIEKTRRAADRAMDRLADIDGQDISMAHRSYLTCREQIEQPSRDAVSTDRRRHEEEERKRREKKQEDRLKKEEQDFIARQHHHDTLYGAVTGYGAGYSSHHSDSYSDGGGFGGGSFGSFGDGGFGGGSFGGW